MKFYKYQGTGNDFILIDNRNLSFPKANTKLIKQLCDRRFGIGADGLILLENDNNVDFKMVYYNSDGNQSSMCGNGGRCLVAFAKQLNIIETQAAFNAIDGLHHATIIDNKNISLQMKNVDKIKIENDYVFLNTGSPHHIMMVDDLQNFEVKTVGHQIRNSDLYGKQGSNINFVDQISENQFAIRTYERGVENETLSCGTGATATAIAMHATNKTNKTDLKINVQGGQLKVSFEVENNKYTNVLLEGPAQLVFKGEI